MTLIGVGRVMRVESSTILAAIPWAFSIESVQEGCYGPYS
jgi:hypothetical protein